MSSVARVSRGARFRLGSVHLPGQLRDSPGFRPGGVDFNAVSVHLDSGTSDRDYTNRRTSLSRISDLERAGTPLATIDIDTVVIGDLNTMGREDQPEILATTEVAGVAGEISPDFRHAARSHVCTEYYQGEGGALDHVLFSVGMQEAPAMARVTGYCAVAQCQDIHGGMPGAYQTLSDHCPVVVEIVNQGDD